MPVMFNRADSGSPDKKPDDKNGKSAKPAKAAKPVKSTNNADSEGVNPRLIISVVVTVAALAFIIWFLFLNKPTLQPITPPHTDTPRQVAPASSLPAQQRPTGAAPMQTPPPPQGHTPQQEDSGEPSGNQGRM